MSQEWKKASCACRGGVELRVNVDLQAGTRRCNCTRCHKRGWWSAVVPLGAVEVVSGEEHVVLDEANPYWHSHTCKGCGLVLYGKLMMPGADPTLGVNVRILDDVDLHGVPVEWLDGLGDTWAPIATHAHRDVLR